METGAHFGNDLGLLPTCSHIIGPCSVMIESDRRGNIYPTLQDESFSKGDIFFVHLYYVACNVREDGRCSHCSDFREAVGVTVKAAEAVEALQ